MASSASGGLKSGILTGVLSFLNAGLIISSLIWFLSETSRNALFSQSHLAYLIASVRNWWLILPVIVLLVAGFLTPKKED
jgi:cell division protein FtsX